MKKIISVISAVIFLLTTINITPLFQTTVHAGTVTTADGIVFDTDTGTITGYTGSASTLDIPSSIEGVDVTILGMGAFAGKTNLTNVTIPSSVTLIDYWAFESCGLTSLTIPNSVIEIKNGAFGACSSLASIIIGSNVTKIGSGAFSYCISLTSVYIPANLTEMISEDAEGNLIHAMCFSNCTSLTEILVDSANPNYQSIDGVLFNKSGDTILEYPCGKTDSGYVIPDGVTYLSSQCFAGHTYLETVTVPEGVIEIGEASFGSCSALTTVYLPNSLESIKSWAFSNCSSLISLTIPQGVTSLGEAVFNWCGSLSAINVASSNTMYSSIDGILFNNAQSKLIQYPQGKTDSTYTIPNSVTEIEKWAFGRCSKLEHVNLPSELSIIGVHAFAECNLLLEIHIPANLDAISDGVFSECRNLTYVEIEDGVTTIGENAFYGCTMLVSILIPQSVTSIAEFSFLDCYPNLVIYGEAGSYAETYANANGITFDSGTYDYSTTMYANGTDGVLALRDGPQGNFIRNYSNGTELLIDLSAIENNYVPTKIGDEIGWMYYPMMTSTNPNASQSYSYTTQMYCNGSDGELNMRTSPTGTVMSAYSNGTPVLIDYSAINNNYVPAQIGSNSGWMYYPYLKSSSPYNYNSTLYCNGSDGELNLRRKPYEGIVIRAYDNNTEVQSDISKKINNYVPVKIGSLYGWMYYPQLSETINDGTIPDPTVIIPDTPNYSQTLYAKGSDGELNLRSASSSGEVISTYANGTPVLADVSLKENNYVPVKIGNNEGWMYYPALVNSGPYIYTDIYYVDGTDGSLNLRRKPSGVVLASYPNDTTVYADASEKLNNYVPVKINGVYGWMYYPYLVQSSPDALGQINSLQANSTVYSLSSTIKLSWDECKNADGYKLDFFKADSNDVYSFYTSRALGATTQYSSSVLSLGLTSGKYRIRISAESNRGMSMLGNSVSISVDSVMQSIEVTSVTLSQTSLTCSPYFNWVLDYTISPSNATFTGVIWKSSNPKVASVSYKGEIIPLTIGTTEITATSYDGPVSAPCIVTVNSVSCDKTMYAKNSISILDTASDSGAVKKTVQCNQQMQVYEIKRSDENKQEWAYVACDGVSGWVKYGHLSDKEVGEIEFIAPLDIDTFWMNSDFGVRPRYSDHTGVDIENNNHIIKASAAGTVIYTGNSERGLLKESWGYAQVVCIAHEIGNEVYLSRYVHLKTDSITVDTDENRSVIAGQVLGELGNTGLIEQNLSESKAIELYGSYEYYMKLYNGLLHLHFDIWKLKKVNYKTKYKYNGNYYAVDYYIDPEILIEDIKEKGNKYRGSSEYYWKYYLRSGGTTMKDNFTFDKKVTTNTNDPNDEYTALRSCPNYWLDNFYIIENYINGTEVYVCTQALRYSYSGYVLVKVDSQIGWMHYSLLDGIDASDLG